MKVLTLKHERVGAFELEVYETVHECPEFEDYKKYAHAYCHNALVRTRKKVCEYGELIDNLEKEINDLFKEPNSRETAHKIARNQQNMDYYMNPFKCLSKRLENLSELEDYINQEATTYEQIKKAFDYFDENCDDEDIDFKVGFYRLNWETIKGYDEFYADLCWEGKE